MNAQALQQFTEKMAATGHWFRVNRIDTTGKIARVVQWTHGWPGIANYYRVIVEGTTIINFDSDVADAKMKMSPGTLTDVLISIIEAIITIATTHTALFLFTIIAIVLAISYFSPTLTNLSSGVKAFLESPTGQIGTVIIIVGVLIALVLVLPSLLGEKRGRRKRRA